MVNTLLMFATKGTPTVSAADLEPLTSTFQANVDVLVPVGIGLMAIMLGIAMIPRIVYKFIG